MAGLKKIIEHKNEVCYFEVLVDKGGFHSRWYYWNFSLT